MKIFELLAQYVDMYALGKLMVAAVLAGLIGYERESRGRAAGLRTHILVSLGSCLAVLTAEALSAKYPGVDPSRIASQIVSGIGFLGAGTIMRSKASVKGLTTAASLWVTACIGMAIGCGYMMGAALATGISLLCLYTLSPLKRQAHK